MKIKTVGLLASLGMMLTSVTVWSLTNPRTTPAREEREALVLPQPPANDTAGFRGAEFTTGKTLMLEGRLGHARLLSDRDNENLLFLNVTAGSDTGTTSRPLNLAIVIDRSGSMKGKRLSNAVAAARGMVERLREGDVVSVVTYNTATQIVVPPTAVSSSRENLVRSLESITAQGDTCISCGLDAGMELLRQHQGMVDRLLLLSDGEATAGVRDVEGFRRLAGSARRMGAAISSIGVDVDYNEQIMAAVAQESNGRHYFVENAAGLPRIFDDELDSLVKTLGRGAELSVALAPGVEVEQVLDRTFRREGDRLIVPLGDFAAGEQKTLLARLKIPRGAAGERAVADVRLTYEDLITRARGECAGKLAALLTTDAGAISPLDPVVAARMNRSETASVLTDANKLLADGQVDEARRRLTKKLDELKVQRQTALRTAPSGRAREVEADFAQQEEALGSANDGFSEAPSAPAAAGAPAPAPPRKAKAQVRANQKRAVDLAF
jgi:Ca-activated chloride channel homolog